jgi:hypothetical protein
MGRQDVSRSSSLWRRAYGGKASNARTSPTPAEQPEYCDDDNDPEDWMDGDPEYSGDRHYQYGYNNVDEHELLFPTILGLQTGPLLEPVQSPERSRSLVLGLR